LDFPTCQNKPRQTKRLADSAFSGSIAPFISDLIIAMRIARALLAAIFCSPTMTLARSDCTTVPDILSLAQKILTGRADLPDLQR
jgi:hypothetical protein